MKSLADTKTKKSAYNLNEGTIALINKLQTEAFAMMSELNPKDTFAFYKQQLIRTLISNRFTIPEIQRLVKLETDFMKPLSDKDLKLPTLERYKEYSWEEKQKHKFLILEMRRDRVHLILRKKLIYYIDSLMLLMRKYGIDLRDEIVKEKLR